MNKAELQNLFTEFNIPLPDAPFTKDELKAALQEAGITSESLKKFTEKKSRENSTSNPKKNVSTKGKSLVVSRNSNSFFSWKGYVFSKTAPYVLMNDDDASELIKYHRGFFFATAEEVSRFYRQND